MTRVPGHVHLTPTNPKDWLGQMASLLARIHDLPIEAPPFDWWIDPNTREIPASSGNPDLWTSALKLLKGDAPRVQELFIHRDYQHFNILWSREQLTGIVDWTWTSTGPREIDVGHCRLNLAVLFSDEWAEDFRLIYEAEAGRRLSPWWDVCALMSYGDGWRNFIPVQVDGRAKVDIGGMTERVDRTLAASLARL